MAHAAAAPTRPRVVIVTGPTGVGKSSVALSLAEALDGEIVCADSVQVYESLDVGSDKTPPAKRRGIPHHLVDILKPSDDFSAGLFVDLARRAIADIHARGKTPIVEGGTGLYLQWLVQGKPDAPAGTQESAATAKERCQQAWEEAERSMGRRLGEEERWKVACDLVERLGGSDKAQRLREEPNNVYRLHRVVEILLLRQQAGACAPGSQGPDAQPLDADSRCFFLVRPRIDLYRRIDSRVEGMLAGGLLEETVSMLRMGVAPDANSAARAIGYRQTMEALLTLAGTEIPATFQDLMNLAQAIQSASRRFSHRQMTWFRSQHGFAWLPVNPDPAMTVRRILQLIAQPPEESEAQGPDERLAHLSAEERQLMKRYATQYDQLRAGRPEAVEMVQRLQDCVAQVRRECGDLVENWKQSEEAKEVAQ